MMHVNKKYFALLFVIGVFLSSVLFSVVSPVSALECKKYGSVCGFTGWSSNPKPCSQGDSGAKYLCCFWTNYPGTNCASVGPSKCACGNSYYVCGGGGGGGGGGNPTPTPCSCSPRGCNPGRPTTKFMTTSVGNGTGKSCNDPCNPSTYNCDPVSVNTKPSCSIAPASISMTREDNPRQINFTAVDADYGDTVQITKVKVVDTAGNLKSCVNVNTLGGGGIENLTVKAGSNNAGATSQTTGLLVDARSAHGVYDNVGGQSICSGFIDIEIRDVDSDGGGPDVSDFASCRVAISVTNQAPTLSDVKIIDQDVMTTVRDSGNNGNLLDGRGQVNMGSPLTTQSKARASVCAEPLAILDPIKCPGGGERYEAGMSSRRNPIQVEFTVKDANGLDDILQAGLWIQRTAQDANDIALPLANVGSKIRNSIQVMYSEKRDEQVVAGVNRWNLVSRACLTPPCGPTSLQSSSNQIFSALAHIPALGAYVGQNGVIKHGDTQWASQKSWHSEGFPDCLFKPSGCANTNVPDNAKTQATAAVNTLANYEWAVAADQNHLICFANNSLVPSVITSSIPTTCPVTCAACAKKEGVELVAGDPTAMRFKFGIYFNDLDGGQGMPEGSYSIFVSALDKVAAPLYSVTGKGADGWLKFNRNGAPCTGANCAAGTGFTLLYDSTPPSIDSDIGWTSTSGTVEANVKFTDGSGSGIGGVTNMFMVRQEMLDGEPLGDRQWATNSNGQPFNGMNERQNLASSAVTYKLVGTGLQGGEDIVTGLCAYDRAGNMTCGRNGTPYVFLAPWLKTSYGDIFSAKGGATPFAQTLPNNDATVKDNTRNLYAPFTEQMFTVGTGLLMTGGVSGQGIGISGGYVINPTTNAQIGFKNYYRTGASSYNVFGHTPFLVGNEFERLRAIGISNCSYLNTINNTNCQTNGSIDSIGAAPYNMIYVESATVTNLICKNANVIFVTGALTVNGSITKDTTTQSGCMFVFGPSALLTINDTPSDIRTPAGDGKGQPNPDKFEAAVVAMNGATVQTTKGARGATTKSTDRLEFRGWVYSANTTPIFKRDLAPVDNKRYPAEWIIYDASLLDVLRPIVGIEKTVDLLCGTTTHPLCGNTTN